MSRSTTSPVRPAAGRYDYANAPMGQLSAWLRQYRKTRWGYEVKCEFGHDDCGCSTVKGMSGIAPCSLAVLAVIARNNA